MEGLDMNFDGMWVDESSQYGKVKKSCLILLLKNIHNGEQREEGGRRGRFGVDLATDGVRDNFCDYLLIQNELVIIQSQEINIMFYFPFYTPSCFYSQPFSPYCHPPQLEVIESQSKLQNQEFPQNLTENASFDKEELIILEREDLEAAGYESHKKIWTQEEDNRLLHYRDKKKMDWPQIAKKIKGRNKKMCYSRYRRLVSSTKDQWLKKHDQQLTNYVEQMGEDWESIAKLFKNRNARQVKDRYNNFLRPGITDYEWTIEDDLKLVYLVRENGKNWKVVEQGLPGRSLNQIKNRFYGRIKRLNDKKLNQLNKDESCSQ